MYCTHIWGIIPILLLRAFGGEMLEVTCLWNYFGEFHCSVCSSFVILVYVALIAMGKLPHHTCLQKSINFALFLVSCVSFGKYFSLLDFRLESISLFSISDFYPESGQREPESAVNYIPSLLWIPRAAQQAFNGLSISQTA